MRGQKQSLPPPRSGGQEGREQGRKRPSGRRPKRSRFEASEGRPGGLAGGAGGSSLPAAATSLSCALPAQSRPVPKNNVSLPGGRAGPQRGEGAAGLEPRCLGPQGFHGSGRGGTSRPANRAPSQAAGTPYSGSALPHPHPLARPGQAEHTWAGDQAVEGRGPGLSRGARAPGRRHRVAGPGPDGGGCGGREWGGRVGPGHGGFTFSLLQSARPSPTQPHRRSPQPFPAPRTDPARRPPLLRRRSRRPHVTGAKGGAAPGAAEHMGFGPPHHVTAAARPRVPSRTLELPD